RDAVELLASLVPSYDASGFVAGQVFSRMYLGEAYWRAGQLNDAERAVRSGLEMASRAGLKFYAGSLHRLLGEITRRVGEDQPDPLPSQIPSCRITATGSSGTTRRAGPRSCDPGTQERIAPKELPVGFPCEGLSSRPSV